MADGKQQAAEGLASQSDARSASRYGDPGLAELHHPLLRQVDGVFG